MEKARNVIQDLYMKHAIDGEGGPFEVAYKGGEIIKLLMEHGFTEEEARKILKEHEHEVVRPYFNTDTTLIQTPEAPHPQTQILYEMMDECDLARYIIDELSKQWNKKYTENPQKYIMEGTLDPTDETEKLIRYIFDKRKTKWPRFIPKHTLIKHLLTKGNTKEEAEKIIEEYQKRQILNHDDHLPADVKQYRPKSTSSSNDILTVAFKTASQEKNKDQEWIDEDHLLCTLINNWKLTETDAQKMIAQNEKNLETKTEEVWREGYAIIGWENLFDEWATTCEDAQEELGLDKVGTKKATNHVEYQDIREIFKEALNQGKKNTHP